VQDADFAAETANLSRSQILQQAGTAMVAQANPLPQGVAMGNMGSGLVFAHGMAAMRLPTGGMQIWF